MSAAWLSCLIFTLSGKSLAGLTVLMCYQLESLSAIALRIVVASVILKPAVLKRVP